MFARLFGVGAIKGAGLPATQQGPPRKRWKRRGSRLLIWLSIKGDGWASRARCCLPSSPPGAPLQKPIRREAKSAWPGLPSAQTNSPPANGGVLPGSPLELGAAGRGVGGQGTQASEPARQKLAGGGGQREGQLRLSTTVALAAPDRIRIEKGREVKRKGGGGGFPSGRAPRIQGRGPAPSCSFGQRSQPPPSDQMAV